MIISKEKHPFWQVTPNQHGLWVLREPVLRWRMVMSMTKRHRWLWVMDSHPTWDSDWTTQHWSEASHGSCSECDQNATEELEPGNSNQAWLFYVVAMHMFARMCPVDVLVAFYRSSWQPILKFWGHVTLKLKCAACQKKIFFKKKIYLCILFWDRIST